MTVKLQDLQYYLIPGEGVHPRHREIYLEAYRMWKEVWSQTFLELDGDPTIYSDDFTRQSNIGALFCGTECVAMTVQHEVNFDFPMAAEDSYFKAWPPEALKELTRDGNQVLVCSHLTVAPGHRGEVTPGLTYKLLVVDLAIRILLESGCSVMTGTMRNNRGAQKTAYTTGATPILANQKLHGVEVDLVGFYRQTIETHLEGRQNLWTERLWSQRRDLRQKAALTHTETARKSGKSA